MGQYKTIEGHDYHFPVVGYGRRSLTTDGVATPKIYGTAFSVGDDCYITAGHSITSAASENDAIGVAFIDDYGKYVLAEALDYEVVSEMDVGFVTTIAHIERAIAHRWETDRIPALATVSATGYPFAIDPTEGGITTRAFMGYIVGRKRFGVLPGKPWVYELSFASPIGLSGAPLIALTNERRVAGLIIGNYETKILVFSDKEIISANKETIVERYHALQFGIAIQSTDLLGIKSRILKGELSIHLRKNALLCQ